MQRQLKTGDFYAMHREGHQTVAPMPSRLLFTTRSTMCEFEKHRMFGECPAVPPTRALQHGSATLGSSISRMSEIFGG